MCWSVPAKIIKIDGNDAMVILGGLEKKVRVDLIENAAKGDYVLIHAGYAIQKLEPEDAGFMNGLIKEIENGA